MYRLIFGAALIAVSCFAFPSRAADEPAPENPRRIELGASYGAYLGTNSFAWGLGLEGAYRFTDELAAGAYLQQLDGYASSSDRCAYDGQCFEAMTRVGGLLKVGTPTDMAFDAWLGVELGANRFRADSSVGTPEPSHRDGSFPDLGMRAGLGWRRGVFAIGATVHWIQPLGGHAPDMAGLGVRAAFHF